MNQKIEWYKEVLALEPASKVFFPLARMQAENGFPDDALATLRHGLSRNPEHIEARLLLIDILYGEGRFEALWPELDQIALMLGGYPGFWSAWNTRLARNPSSKDASLALSFFSATLRGEAVSWSDVIEQGLAKLLSGESRDIAGPKVAPAQLGELHSYLNESPLAGVPTQPPAPPGPTVRPDGPVRPAREEAREDPPEGEPDAENPSPSQAGQSAYVQFQDEIEALGLDELKTDELDLEPEHEEDEVFSLKTRSMAEILAEQGDYSGALEVYEELLRQAHSDEERASLEAAVAGLNARAGDAGQNRTEEREGDEASLPAGQGKNRLLDVLEALAQRLEARN